MTERGTISKIRGNYVTIKIERHSACDKCGMCGLSSGQKYAEVEALNTENAAVGDVVDVNIESGSATKTALSIYLIPLLLALALFFLAYFLSLPEWAQIVAFVFGCAVGFAVVAIVEKGKKRDMPVTFKKIDGGKNNEQSS